MGSVTVDIRNATPSDASGISAVYDAAWRTAYAGIIPALHLERMIQRRGPAWWMSAAGKARGNLIVLDVGERIAGYAMIGWNRSKTIAATGEIHELYLKPEYQGLGFGRRLLRSSLDRLIASERRRSLVWVLEDNETALSFYLKAGGRMLSRGEERFGATLLPKVSIIFE